MHGVILRSPLRRFSLALLIGVVLIGGPFVTALHVHADGLTDQHCAACVSGHAAADLARPLPAIEPFTLDRGPAVIFTFVAPPAGAATPARSRAPPRG
jgi:hypothetical protein